MIGRLKGVVISVAEETALIDVNGVGYEIYAAPRVLQGLTPGEEATLSIETLVREDLIRLFGFPSESERRAFRLLQSVQGVGARHALGILQVLTPSDLYDAVAAEDVTSLARAHGVGKTSSRDVPNNAGWSQWICCSRAPGNDTTTPNPPSLKSAPRASRIKALTRS
jgi:Holliday junction DNA helicase RuvA